MEERFDRLDRFRDQRDRRLDQFLETGRQLVDGVSGRRPGQRPGGRRSGLDLDSVGRWVGEKVSGCWQRPTTGRSPGKRLAVAGQSLRVRCAPPVAPSRPSPAVAAAEQERRLQRPHQRRLWLRSSTLILGSGPRTTASGCSAGHARPSRQPVRSPKLPPIQRVPAGLCRAPAAAGPTNGWGAVSVG